MKWDIDKALAGGFEPESCPGTGITRIYVDVGILKSDGIKVTPADIERGGANIWCLALGKSYERKAFFYGRTIRAAWLAARKALKKPWAPKAKKERRKRKVAA